MNRRTNSLVFTLLVCLPFSNEIGATRTHAGSSQSIPDQPISSQSIPAQPISSQSIPAQLISSQPISAQSISSQPISAQPNAQQSICERLIGDWQSEKFGTQTLSTNADGTAVLKMQLSTMAAVLYGREVTLLLKWKLDGSALTQHVVGGSPERSVDKLTRKYGTTYCYRIVELTGNQLVVEDTSTGKTSCWESLQAVSQER